MDTNGLCIFLSFAPYLERIMPLKVYLPYIFNKYWSKMNVRCRFIFLFRLAIQLYSTNKRYDGCIDARILSFYTCISLVSNKRSAYTRFQWKHLYNTFENRNDPICLLPLCRYSIGPNCKSTCSLEHVIYEYHTVNPSIFHTA